MQARQILLADQKVDDPIENTEIYDSTELTDEDLTSKPGTREFLRDSTIYYSALWIFRMFYVRNKNARIFDTSLSKWGNNISQFPVSDDGDQFFTNYVVHPFAGMMSFLYYRQMEHELWVAALGSALQSTLFEYTIEGLVETPSLSDLIFTPLIGVPVGYGLERTSDWFYNTNSKLGKVAAHLINPMRNLIDDRKIALFNPLTGQYEFKGTFQTTLPTHKQKSIQYSYPVLFEPALPTGYFRAFIEVAEMGDQFNNGEFIFYHVKAEFPSKDHLYSAYIRVSQAGVNNINGEKVRVRDGFELANILLGGKSVLYKTENSAYTAGLEVILPLAYKDNVNRLKTIVDNSLRDFPFYVRKTLTFTPYFSTLHYHKWLSIQNNIALDVVTRARKLEGDGIETRLKYNSSVGVSPPWELTDAVIFGEFNGITTFTADTFKNTDLSLAVGTRIGRRFSPGFTARFPLNGTTDDNTRFSYTVDMTIRF